MVAGLIIASLVLVLSVFAVILEGPAWRSTLETAVRVSQDDCESKNGTCVCSKGLLPL